ncbi:MAG: hypothetical protein Q9191_004290 [Dirinaria sp. TL-2023a]
MATKQYYTGSKRPWDAEVAARPNRNNGMLSPEGRDTETSSSKDRSEAGFSEDDDDRNHADEVRAELINLSLHAPSADDGRPPLSSGRQTGHCLVLSICLPSAHTGGDILCSVGTKSKSFSTSATSEFENSYIAAYSDVHRESKPIESGIRLLLTYNIVFETAFGMEIASKLTSYAKDFEKELAVWKRLRNTSRAPSILVYVLDEFRGHGYRFSALGKEDKLKANYLRERCLAEGVYSYMSTMKYTSTIDECGEEGEASLVLQNLVDFDDFDVLEGSVIIDFENLIRDNIFDDREPQHSDYDQGRGVETCAHHYVDSVMPRGVLYHFEQGISMLIRASILLQDKEFFVRAVKTRNPDFDFVCGFLQILRDHVADAAVEAQAAAVLVRDILPGVVSYFGLHFTRPSVKRQKLQPKSSSPYSSIPDDGNRMASVVEFCRTLGLINDAQPLIDSVKERLTIGDSWWLRWILMPFMIDLAAAMEKRDILLTSKENQDFFQQSVSLFIAKYVTPPPQCPRDWSMPPRGCKCKDCWEQLDWFLGDPNSQHFEYIVTRERRDHLSQRLAGESSVRKITRNNGIAPHTLVLDKTRDGYNQALKAWAQRCNEAKSLIGSIRVETLRQLLADRYSELTQLRCVLPEERFARNFSQTTSRHASPGISDAGWWD